jgi:hypothetical protein
MRPEKRNIARLTPTACLFLLLCALIGKSQSPPGNIYPIVSNRADVAKAFGMQSDMTDGNPIYDVGNERIAVTFFPGPCDQRAGGPSITKDTVMELSVTPKERSSMPFAPLSKPDFEQHLLPTGSGNGRVFYTDLRNGVLIVAKIDGAVETHERTYFFIPKSKLSDCMIQSLDDTSAIALLNYYGIEKTPNENFDFQPIQAAVFFEEDPRRSKDQMRKAFVYTLRQHKNGYGFLTFYLKKGESADTRRRRLMDELIKLGVPCDRIFVSSVSTGESWGMTNLYVVHKKFLGDKNLKSACG